MTVVLHAGAATLHNCLQNYITACCLLAFSVIALTTTTTTAVCLTAPKYFGIQVSRHESGEGNMFQVS